MLKPLLDCGQVTVNLLVSTSKLSEVSATIENRYRLSWSVAAFTSTVPGIVKEGSPYTRFGFLTAPFRMPSGLLLHRYVNEQTTVTLKQKGDLSLSTDASSIDRRRTKSIRQLFRS